MPKASVIIPIYNAESTISRCLESIIEQTFKDFEVICMDDGSRDASYRIVREYQEKFAGVIKAYTQENGGAGKARNKAMGLAAGKYLFFVDGDDYIALDYIQRFVEAAENSGADMVIGGYERVDEEGKCIFRDKFRDDASGAPFKRTAGWGRVYRTDFISACGLKFSDNKIGEDFYFNAIAAALATKTSVIDYTGYFWVDNPESATNTHHLTSSLDKMTVALLEDIHDTLLLFEIDAEKRLRLEYLLVKFSVFYLLYYGKKVKPGQMAISHDTIFSALKNLYPDYRKNRLIGLFTPGGEDFKTRAAVFLTVTLERIGLRKSFFKLYAKIMS